MLTNRLSLLYRYQDSAPSNEEIIYVNPATIEYAVQPGFAGALGTHKALIKSGSWDKIRSEGERKIVPIFNKDIPASIRQRFLEGKEWEETDFFQNALESLEDDQEYSSRVNSISDIYDRCGVIDHLYTSMKREGYKSQEELGESFPRRKEVQVAIGRDGELLLDDGQHRLALSKILSIRSIPVRVLVRHERWQEIRYKFVSQGTLPNYVNENHPDLRNIHRT